MGSRAGGGCDGRGGGGWLGRFRGGPVGGDVVADGVDEFTGYVAEGLVAEDLHGAVVGLERVVEGEFVLRKSQLLAAGVRLAYLVGERD